MPAASTGMTHGRLKKSVSRKAVAAVTVRIPTAAKANAC